MHQVFKVKLLKARKSDPPTDKDIYVHIRVDAYSSVTVKSACFILLSLLIGRTLKLTYYAYIYTVLVKMIAAISLYLKEETCRTDSKKRACRRERETHTMP